MISFNSSKNIFDVGYYFFFISLKFKFLVYFSKDKADFLAHKQVKKTITAIKC